MINFVSELRWRGLVQDIMPGTEDLLCKEKTRGYIGFDPTADSLHIGNMVPVMLLTHLQLSGHQPVVLVGGATGLIGDPSGKTAERALQSIEAIHHNLECQKKQLMRFLDFSHPETGAIMVNNYDWFKDIGFLTFIRDVGKHITVNYMMSKDSVKNRLESGMSFTEFSYQLIQGYDFYHLYKNMGCKLQMGGSDQWGNIVTGTELIRRMDGGEAFALTAPLVKKADGTKFGKSEGGNIWLDREKTSPYKFYQYWLNASDEDIVGFTKTFSLRSQKEISELEKEHMLVPHLRTLQKVLAEELTERVHSSNDLKQAKSASEILFGKSTTDMLERLPEQTFLEVFEGVNQVEITRDQLSGAHTIPTLLSEMVNNSIFKSKGEARRMIQGGGVSINKIKVEEQSAPSQFVLLQGKYLLVQTGKKNYHIITVL